MHNSTIWPTAPGAIIGYRRNGTPIRLQAGASQPPGEPAGDPPADPAGGQPTGQEPPANPAPQAQEPAPAGQSQGQPAPAAGGQEPPAPAAEPTSVDQLPAWAQRELRTARNDAAAQRAKAKETADAVTALEQKSQQQLDAIAKALGLKPEDATPEQIAAERDAERARAETAAAAARASAVELAVFRAAASAGADGNKLLDSRSFTATLAGLDPAADGFADRVTEAITTAVEAHPDWKTAPAAAPPAPPAAPAQPTVPRSGAEFGTPPDGARQWTIDDVQRATPRQVEEAQEKGLLQNLGFGKARKDRRYGT